MTGTGGTGRSRAERNLAWIARVARLLTAPFVRYDIRGGRCVPDLHVGIVAMNHRSMFDVAAGLIALHHFRRYPRILIERKYLEGRWTAPFARAIGAIPVDRDKGGGTSVQAALAALGDGIPIVVMPEGKLNWDPANPRSMGPTRTGVSRLAVGAGVPVVPVGMSGTERVMSGSGRPRLNPFRRKTVICHVADEPLWLEGDDHRANTDTVVEAICSLIVVQP